MGVCKTSYTGANPVLASMSGFTDTDTVLEFPGKRGSVAERIMAPALKADGCHSPVGSNPTASSAQLQTFLPVFERIVSSGTILYFSFGHTSIVQ